VEYYANQTGVYLPESYQLIPPPAPDLVTTVNYYLGMITEPVGTWLENNIGSAVPSIIPLVDYLFIQMPIVLVILIILFLVFLRIIALIRRRKKSKKPKLQETYELKPKPELPPPLEPTPKPSEPAKPEQTGTERNIEKPIEQEENNS
jgi:hypothetical protein